jgi:hypothetical protein
MYSESQVFFFHADGQTGGNYEATKLFHNYLQT